MDLMEQPESESVTVRFAVPAPEQAKPASAPIRTSRAGQRLGNYQLLRPLAEGGFAEIYLGEHIYLSTYAAIKILQAQLATEDLTSFRREARIVARLRHPHIVSILDFDVEDGVPFLVMDYAANGTLRQRHPKGTIIPPTTILPYLRQVADALQFAHEQRLVHRDVKPDNMLIGWRNEILLSDFGIAVVLQSSHAETKHDVIGTIAYMAPEQFKGEALPASDQYALGVVVYEWLCGQCPFHGTIPEMAEQHLHAAPPSLCQRNSQISTALEQVVFRALAKDPEQRYRTVLDFVHAFAAACPQQALVLPAFEEGALRPSSSESYHAETVRVQLSGPSPASSTLPQPAIVSKGAAQQKRRGISRRAALLSLGGITALGLGGGMAWAVRSRLYTQIPQFWLPPAKSTPASKTTTKPTSSQKPIGTRLVTYRGHTGVVSSASWSPQGGLYIASGSWDHTARVWHASTGIEVHSYTGHSDSVNAVAWAPPDGQYVASASSDHTVQIWAALQDGMPGLTYQNHQDVVNAVAWSPDGQQIASASNDTTVHIWTAGDGNDITVFTGHHAPVRTVAWEPSSGQYIASAGADRNVLVWKPTTNDTGAPPLVDFQGHNDTVNAVAWSPDGQYLASASNDRTVLIWHAMSGGYPLVSYQQHHAAVNAVAWSPDGKRIASASSDGTVRVWDSSSGDDIFTYQGHSSNGPQPVYSVMWSPDGRYIASAGADNTVQVWYA